MCDCALTILLTTPNVDDNLQDEWDLINSNISEDLEHDWENITSRELSETQRSPSSQTDETPKNEKLRQRDKLLNWRNRMLSPFYNLYHTCMYLLRPKQ
jgi:hypothetical protein